MTEKQALKLPLHLVLLDGIGAILLGLGFAEKFARLNILPASMQFGDKGTVLIVAGALLMLPLMIHLFGKIRLRAEEKLIK